MKRPLRRNGRSVSSAESGDVMLGIGWSDRLGFAGYQTYTVRELNVVSERLVIQPRSWGHWLYRLWAGVPANRVCLAV